MIPTHFIKALRCPETGQPLTIATAEQVAELEARRKAGTLRFSSDRLQWSPEAAITAALLRESDGAAYLIQNGIPLLLPGHAVVL